MPRAGGVRIGVVGAAMAALSGVAAAHDTPMYVGTSSTGQLRIWFNFAEVEELTQQQAGFPGWLSNLVTLDEVIFNDPVRDLHPITDGSKIMLEVVDFDPALAILSPDLSVRAEAPGERIGVGTGGSQFVSDPWWYLDRTHPDFDIAQGTWEGRFKIIDLNGNHADSAVYTFTVMVPAPASAGLLAIGVGLMSRRRR